MKSPNALLAPMLTPIAVSAVALATLLAGCGQTGPLYMPKRPAQPPAATATAATPAAATPAAAAKTLTTPPAPPAVPTAPTR